MTTTKYFTAEKELFNGYGYHISTDFALETSVLE